MHTCSTLHRGRKHGLRTSAPCDVNAQCVSCCSRAAILLLESVLWILAFCFYQVVCTSPDLLPDPDLGIDSHFGFVLNCNWNRENKIMSINTFYTQNKIIKEAWTSRVQSRPLFSTRCPVILSKAFQNNREYTGYWSLYPYLLTTHYLVITNEVFFFFFCFYSQLKIK